MKADIYWIQGPWPGRLGTFCRPRGGDWLADEVRSWREAGLDVVTSLLTPEEIADLDLAEEEALSREEGLAFYSFPIPDYSVPEYGQELFRFVRCLEQALAAGKNVGIHCRQALGRSTLIAACLLISAGIEPGEALLRIKKARREQRVPDTDEQRDWVFRIAADAEAWDRQPPGSRL